jgi:hypothetical protein
MEGASRTAATILPARSLAKAGAPQITWLAPEELEAIAAEAGWRHIASVDSATFAPWFAGRIDGLRLVRYEWLLVTDNRLRRAQSARRCAVGSNNDRMPNLAPRVCALALAASAVLSGCVQTTSGSPVRAPRSSPAGPTVPTLSDSALDQIMLSVSDISSIVGGKGLQVTNSAQEFADSSDTIDNVECLGVMFAAERQVYEGSNWEAVRDQIIRDPGDNKKHWVEQTVVLFSSWEKAADFLNKAHDQWSNCANKSVTTKGSGNKSYKWKLGQVGEPSDTEVTIDMNQQNSDNWSCQHALSAVSNIIIEGVACGQGISNEAEKIVQRISHNATTQ